MNRAWFQHLFIDEDDDGLSIADAGREPLSAAIQQELAQRRLAKNRTNEKRRQQMVDGVSDVLGLNFELLVELRGLEPLTLTLPV